MKKIILSWALIIIISKHPFSQWQVQPVSIKTRWAKDINPDKPLPEYPRPQMIRTAWTNLNGLWDYAITSRNSQKPTHYDGKILVPYPVESALSGIQQQLTANQSLWYRKCFKVYSSRSQHKRTLLHFGAVDYEATVFINGKLIGSHSGGYTGFTFDISDALYSGENEIIVRVFDPSDKGNNPHGKQVINPEGIFYTSSSGIWQTVWLENVPENFISSFTVTPDIDRSLINIKVNADANGDVKVEAAGKVATGTANQNITLPISNPKLWSPDNPYLYDIKIVMGKDIVQGYFGMRKIEIKKDEKGIERIFLNNKYTYNLGTLDQGFWPDGLYTAPTDQALKFDIEASKAMGFNTIRKHIKIEPARWYYYADKLGMLVWQDMVNPANTTEEGKNAFEKGCTETITQLYNYPSIICWVLFNENWGAYNQARLAKWIKDMDPSRILNGHTGSLIVNYTSAQNTPEGLRAKSENSDMTDIHSYPPPGMPAYISGKAMALGEFGGIGVSIDGHLWDDVASGWGYGGTVSAGTMRKQYAAMIDSLISFEKRGLSASIYTQPFDVEAEQNGLITYDREILKIPATQIRTIHSRLWPTTKNYALAAKNFNLKIADSGKTDLATRVSFYNQRKKDSAHLRALALTAAAEQDSASLMGRRYANEYIQLIHNPFALTNLKFINRFTGSIEDKGFNILLNNLKKVNNILGSDVAERTIIKAIENDLVKPEIKNAAFDYHDLINTAFNRYGSIGQEAVMQSLVAYAVKQQNWKIFSELAEKWFDEYGSKRQWVNDFILNDFAWATFQGSSDISALKAALKMSAKTIINDPPAIWIDTYANLLYKLGRNTEAIEWEKKAANIAPLEPSIKTNFEKMQRGEKTWD